MGGVLSTMDIGLDDLPPRSPEFSLLEAALTDLSTSITPMFSRPVSIQGFYDRQRLRR